jgi:hypothetical protein
MAEYIRDVPQIGASGVEAFTAIVIGMIIHG